MKFKHLFFSLLAAAGVGCNAVAGEAAAEPQRYHVFYDGGLMIPGEDAPGYKKAIYDATGTAFGVELGVGLWAIDNQAPGSILQLHPDFTLVADEAALELVKDLI